MVAAVRASRLNQVGKDRLLAVDAQRQSHFVTWEKLRRELGYNSVIDTVTHTGREGHVLRSGNKGRARKLIAGCPAFRNLWDLTPVHTLSGTLHRLQSAGNRLVKINGQPGLCRAIPAEAQTQDRPRVKTWQNTAQTSEHASVIHA